jgi:small GTP-binding protein
VIYLLSYLDQKKVPNIIVNFPESIEAEYRDNIIKIFNIDLKSSFFEVKYNGVQYLNYKFEIHPLNTAEESIPSLLSVILVEDQPFFSWKSNMENLIQEIKSIPNISEIFTKNLTGNPVIQMKITKIERIFRKNLQNYKEKKNQHPHGHLLFVGIEKVGKSSIVNRLRNKSFSEKIRPTLGTQILHAAIEKFKFQVYDVGGQKVLRNKWFHECKNPDGIVYVIDVTSLEKRIDEYKEEFERVINHYFASPGKTNPSEIPILVLLNKIDLMDQETLLEVKERVISLLNSSNITNPFSMHLISAKSNFGIEDAFKWFISLKLMQ